MEGQKRYALVVDDPERQLDRQFQTVGSVHGPDLQSDRPPAAKRACPEVEPLALGDLPGRLSAQQLDAGPDRVAVRRSQQVPDQLVGRLHHGDRTDADGHSAEPKRVARLTQARPRARSIRRSRIRPPSARNPLWSYSLVSQPRRPGTSANVSSPARPRSPPAALAPPTIGWRSRPRSRLRGARRRWG